jgi:hypothetical protein
MKANKKITLTLFCGFTHDEIEERGQEISTAVLEYSKLSDDKSATVKQYNETLTRIESRIADLAKSIRHKGVEKPTEVLVQFHRPVPGLKTMVRLDTGEIIRQEDMTTDEKQENLFDEVDALTDLYVEGEKDEGKEQ